MYLTCRFSVYRNTLKTQKSFTIFRSSHWRSTARIRPSTRPPPSSPCRLDCVLIQSQETVWPLRAALLWGNALHAGLTSRAEPQHTTQAVSPPTPLLHQPSDLNTHRHDSLLLWVFLLLNVLIYMMAQIKILYLWFISLFVHLFIC